MVKKEAHLKKILEKILISVNIYIYTHKLYVQSYYVNQQMLVTQQRLHPKYHFEAILRRCSGKERTWQTQFSSKFGAKLSFMPR